MEDSIAYYIGSGSTQSATDHEVCRRRYKARSHRVTVYFVLYFSQPPAEPYIHLAVGQSLLPPCSWSTVRSRQLRSAPTRTYSQKTSRELLPSAWPTDSPPLPPSLQQPHRLSFLSFSLFISALCSTLLSLTRLTKRRVVDVSTFCYNDFASDPETTRSPLDWLGLARVGGGVWKRVAQLPSSCCLVNGDVTRDCSSSRRALTLGWR